MKKLLRFLVDRTLLGFSLLWNPEWAFGAWAGLICFLVGLVPGLAWFFLGDQPMCSVFVKDEGCLVFNFTKNAWSTILSGISAAGFAATAVVLLGAAFAVYAERRWK